jgi:hypothetical protein
MGIPSKLLYLEVQILSLTSVMEVGVRGMKIPCYEECNDEFKWSEGASRTTKGVRRERMVWIRQNLNYSIP